MKYRLTINPAIELGMDCLEILFVTQLEMDAAETACAKLLIYLSDEKHAMEDFSNMFIKEVWINGEWEEIEA